MNIGFEARQKSYQMLVKKVKGGSSLTPTELTTMMRFEEELKQSGQQMLPDAFTAMDKMEQYTGYKARTIYKAVEDGKLVRLSDGSFDRDDVDSWLRSKGKDPQPLVNTPILEQDLDDLDDKAPSFNSKTEEAKFRHFRAREKELLVKRLEGELLPRDVILAQQVTRAHEFKTSLLLLGRRVSHKIAAVAGIESKVVDTILDEEVKLLLASLCRKVELDVD